MAADRMLRTARPRGNGEAAPHPGGGFWLELDRTTIAIRERAYPDILDLALRVIRAHAGPLLAALALGAIPLALLNHWLLWDYADADIELGFPFQYVVYTLLLVTWEMPLAAAPATAFLGEAMFNRRPQRRRVLRTLRQTAAQVFLYQVLYRGWPVPLVLFAPTWVGTLALLGLMIYWPILYITRPYLGEVILLERNPLQPTRANAMTTSRRSGNLHGGYTGDLFARWLAALAAGGLLFGSVWGSIWLLRAALLTEIRWDSLMWTWYFQASLWLVAGFFTVVRFLSYLDLRIRREGWEVELRMRAEEGRLVRSLA